MMFTYIFEEKVKIKIIVDDKESFIKLIGEDDVWFVDCSPNKNSIDFSVLQGADGEVCEGVSIKKIENSGFDFWMIDRDKDPICNFIPFHNTQNQGYPALRISANNTKGLVYFDFAEMLEIISDKGKDK